MLTRSNRMIALRAIAASVVVLSLFCGVPAAAPQVKATTKPKVSSPTSKPTSKPTGKPTGKPTAEKSVKPGINKKFLAEDLDVESSKRTFEGESREVYVHRHRIAKQVEIEPGSTVADIGAGTGLFLDLFAKGVGVKGKLFAVDISPKFIEYLGQRAKQKGLAQVETVLCTGTSSKLPEASVDVAFVCDTYHHFEYPQSTLESLRRAIKPGGRLVIVDFERIPGVSREFIMGHVRCGKEKVIEEVVAAGFRFVDQVRVKGLVENYLIRFARDKDPETKKAKVRKTEPGSRPTSGR